MHFFELVGNELTPGIPFQGGTRPHIRLPGRKQKLWVRGTHLPYMVNADDNTRISSGWITHADDKPLGRELVRFKEGKHPDTDLVAVLWRVLSGTGRSAHVAVHPNNCHLIVSVQGPRWPHRSRVHGIEGVAIAIMGPQGGMVATVDGHGIGSGPIHPSVTYMGAGEFRIHDGHIGSTVHPLRAIAAK